MSIKRLQGLYELQGQEIPSETPENILSLPIPANKLQLASRLTLPLTTVRNTRSKLLPPNNQQFPQKHTPARISTASKPSFKKSRLLDENPFLAPANSTKLITIDKENHKSTPLLTQPNPTNDDLLERIALWKSKFKLFTVFLHGVDAAKQVHLSKSIKELGAHVTTFLRRGVTHFVTTHDTNFIENNDSKRSVLHPPTAKTSKSNDHDLIAASKLGCKIWPLYKLEKILKILPHADSKAHQPKKLKDALKYEKIYGPSTNRDPEKKYSNFHSFKGVYFMIEEPSGQYKPIIVKDYSDVSDKKISYPEIKWNNRMGYCAFVAEAVSSSQSDSSNEECNTEYSENSFHDITFYSQKLKEIQNHADGNMCYLSEDDIFDLDNLPSDNEGIEKFKLYAIRKLGIFEKLKSGLQPNSAASGLVSGSAAIVPKRDFIKDSRLANLEHRVLPLNGRNIQKNSEKIKGKAVRSIQGKSFYRRAGYCENCNIKYEEFSKHVKSKQHKGWARRAANFKSLDQVLLKMQRVEAPPPLDVEESASCNSGNVDCNYSELNEDEKESENEEPDDCVPNYSCNSFQSTEPANPTLSESIRNLEKSAPSDIKIVSIDGVKTNNPNIELKLGNSPSNLLKYDSSLDICNEMNEYKTDFMNAQVAVNLKKLEPESLKENILPLTNEEIHNENHQLEEKIPKITISYDLEATSCVIQSYAAEPEFQKLTPNPRKRTRMSDNIYSPRLTRSQIKKNQDALDMAIELSRRESLAITKVSGKAVNLKSQDNHDLYLKKKETRKKTSSCRVKPVEGLKKGKVCEKALVEDIECNKMKLRDHKKIRYKI